MGKGVGKLKDIYILSSSGRWTVREVNLNGKET